jgi:hypothetical protein
MTGLQLHLSLWAAIGATDMATLWLCGGFLGLKLSQECDSIELSKVLMQHLGENIASHWRIAFNAMSFVQRHLFLAALPMLIVLVILTKGSDALSICLNAVAIGFLCEIDDVVYTVAMPHEVRARLRKVVRQATVSAREVNAQF